jgi:hypothetical protein
MNKFLYIFVVTSLLSSPIAQARPGSASEGNELSHFLSIGAGIASPSPNLALLENPTGLAYNTGAKVQASVRAGGGFDPLNPGLHLLLGNGSVGAAVGYRHSSSDSTDGNALEYGLSASIDSINMALGLGGSLTFNDSSANSDLNLGLLFNQNGTITFGATAFSVIDGPSLYGVGASLDLSQYATLALDGISNSDFNMWSMKPGLGIHLSELQLSVGYGFDVNRGGAGRDGISVGAGFKLGSSIHFAAYYEQVSRYFASIQFRM